MAYDRLLARVFTGPDADAWMLKRAGGLLARLGDARHTRDLDLSATADLRAAEASLRRAAATDIGDHFTLRVGPAEPLRGQVPGLRVPVHVDLGKPYAAFHVDIVTGVTATGPAEQAAPLTPVRIPGLVQPSYRVYPVADHVADKLAGVLATHPRRSGGADPSSRYKDLADLALIASGSRLEADRLHLALHPRRCSGPSRCRPGSRSPTPRAGAPATTSWPETPPRCPTSTLRYSWRPPSSTRCPPAGGMARGTRSSAAGGPRDQAQHGIGSNRADQLQKPPR